MIAQAITDGRWTRHLKQPLSVHAVWEYMSLWTRIQGINLVNHLDAISWRWAANSEFSMASAYAIQFEGSQRSNFKEIIWKSGAPLKCRIYSWMAVLGGGYSWQTTWRRGGGRTTLPDDFAATRRMTRHTCWLHDPSLGIFGYAWCSIATYTLAWCRRPGRPRC